MSIWNSITSPISSVGSYFSQSSLEEQQQQQQSLSQSSRSNDGNQQSELFKKQEQQYDADKIFHLLQQPSPCWVLLSDQTLDPDDVPEWQTHDFKKSTATQVQQAQYYFLILHNINNKSTISNNSGDNSKDLELHLYDAIPSISSKSQQPVMRINLCQYKCLLFPHNLHVSMMYDRKLPILLQSAAPDNRQSSDRYGLRSELYIWFPTAMFKEDWYLSLRMRISSQRHSQYQQYQQQQSHSQQQIEYSRLLANDYSQSAQMNVSYNHEDPTTAWFNALLVRVFPSIVRFEEFNMYVEELLTRKFQLMRTPDFMDDLSLKNFSIDSQPPVLSNAELVQASADGHTEIKFNVKYEGRFEVEAEMNLNLSKMNNNISLLLPKMSIPARVKISFTRLEGRMLVLIKKNPSNRLWFGFTEMPRVYVDISPMINFSKNNELSLDYAIIVQFLQDKFMTVIKEELVYPHMGDVDIPGNSESFDYLFTPGNQGFTSLINEMKVNKQIKKKAAATKGGNGSSQYQSSPFSQEEQNSQQSAKHKRVTSAPMPNAGRYTKLSDQISHRKHLKQQSSPFQEASSKNRSAQQTQKDDRQPHVDLRHDKSSSMGSSVHRKSRSFEGSGADFVDDSLSYTLNDNLQI
ncbi:hypothetical protein MIR68_011445 [Amoeboaphelidium protococcarum]|nr:hypothetical protein MIR68_011445 [Amoeboaphelidium protococcarum]